MIITAAAAKIVPMILVLFAAMIILMVSASAELTVPARKIDESNVEVAHFFRFFTYGIFNEINYNFQVLIYELIQTLVCTEIVSRVIFASAFISSLDKGKSMRYISCLRIKIYQNPPYIRQKKTAIRIVSVTSDYLIQINATQTLFRP
jgi:hypothetical protein